MTGNIVWHESLYNSTDSFVCLLTKTLNYFTLWYFDFEHTRWRLFQKHVIFTKLNTVKLFLCPKDDHLIQAWLFLVMFAVLTSKTKPTEICLCLYLVTMFIYFYFNQMWHLPRNVRCRNREPSERIYTISRNIK